MAFPLGTAVIVFEKPGVVRFFGFTQFAQGEWVGVELDDEQGKNDGTVNGIRYFSCPDKRGMFVRPASVQLVTNTSVNEQSKRLAERLQRILSINSSSDSKGTLISEMMSPSTADQHENSDSNKKELSSTSTGNSIRAGRTLPQPTRIWNKDPNSKEMDALHNNTATIEERKKEMTQSAESKPDIKQEMSQAIESKPEIKLEIAHAIEPKSEIQSTRTPLKRSDTTFQQPVRAGSSRFGVVGRINQQADLEKKAKVTTQARSVPSRNLSKQPSSRLSLEAPTKISSNKTLSRSTLSAQKLGSINSISRERIPSLSSDIVYSGHIDVAKHYSPSSTSMSSAVNTPRQYQMDAIQEDPSVALTEVVQIPIAQASPIGSNCSDKIYDSENNSSKDAQTGATISKLTVPPLLTRETQISSASLTLTVEDSSISSFIQPISKEGRPNHVSRQQPSRAPVRSSLPSRAMVTELKPVGSHTPIAQASPIESNCSDKIYESENKSSKETQNGTTTSKYSIPSSLPREKQISGPSLTVKIEDSNISTFIQPISRDGKLNLVNKQQPSRAPLRSSLSSRAAAADPKPFGPKPVQPLRSLSKSTPTLPGEKSRPTPLKRGASMATAASGMLSTKSSSTPSRKPPSTRNLVPRDTSKARNPEEPQKIIAQSNRSLDIIGPKSPNNIRKIENSHFDFDCENDELVTSPLSSVENKLEMCESISLVPNTIPEGNKKNVEETKKLEEAKRLEPDCSQQALNDKSTSDALIELQKKVKEAERDAIKVRDLQTSLDRAIARVTELEGNTDKLKKQHAAELRAEHELMKDLKRKLIAESKSSGKQTEILNATIADLNENIELLSLDKEQLSLEKEMLEEQLGTLQGELEGARIDAAKSQNPNIETNIVSNDSAGMEELLSKNRALKEALQRVHETRSSEKIEMTKKIRQLEGIIDSKMQLEAELIELQKWKDEKTEEIAILKGQVDQAGEHEKIVEMLTEKNLDLEDKAATLESQMLDLENTIELGEELESQQTQEIKLLQAELNAAEIGLSNAVAKAEASEKALIDVQSKLSQVSTVAVQLKSDYAESIAEKEILENELAVLKKKLSSALAEKASIVVENDSRVGTVMEMKLMQIKLSAMSARAERLRMLLPADIVSIEISRIDTEILATEVAACATVLLKILIAHASHDILPTADALSSAQQREFEAQVAVTLSKMIGHVRVIIAQLVRSGEIENLESLPEDYVVANGKLLQCRSIIELFFSVLISEGSLLASAASIPHDALISIVDDFNRREYCSDFGMILGGSALEEAAVLVLAAAMAATLKSLNDGNPSQEIVACLEGLRKDLDRLHIYLLAPVVVELTMNAEEVSHVLLDLQNKVACAVSDVAQGNDLQSINSLRQHVKGLVHQLPKGFLHDEQLLIDDDLWTLAIPQDSMPSVLRAKALCNRLSSSVWLESELNEAKIKLADQAKVLHLREKEITTLVGRSSHLENIMKLDGKHKALEEHTIEKDNFLVEEKDALQVENDKMKESLKQLELRMKALSSDNDRLRKKQITFVEEQIQLNALESSKLPNESSPEVKNALNESFVAELKILHRKLMLAKRHAFDKNNCATVDGITNLVPLRGNVLNSEQDIAEVSRILSWLEQSILQVRLNPKVIDLSKMEKENHDGARKLLDTDEIKLIDLVHAWRKTYEILQTKAENFGGQK